MQSPTIPGREPVEATHEDGPAGDAAKTVSQPEPGVATRAGAATGAGGTTRAVQRFTATHASVARARRFLLDQLPGGCRDGRDVLALMLSELATNSVQHADTEFEVDVATTDHPGGRWVRVSVTDEASGFPTPQEPAPDAPHGRGLRIVESLADAWGIEMRRDRPGKTVWCTSWVGPADTPSPVSGPPEEAGRPVGVATGAPDAAGAQLVTGPWPVPGVRAVLDGLRDGVVASDEHGVIHYANAAAEELMGWPVGSLLGRSALDLVPESMTGPLAQGFGSFMRSQAEGLAGRSLPAVIKRADGSEVHTEVVMSMFEHPLAGRVAVGVFRRRDDRKLQRWSELTSELLTLLADAPIDDPPAERLLATLGRRLDWDVTTLWTLSGGGRLVCRHVWTRSPRVAPSFAQERAKNPTSGSDGLPRWVMEHGEPIWVTDLAHDQRFTGDALVRHGLQSAYAFPIRYRGACVGIVEMLSTRPREHDFSVVELMDAVGGHLGELLHASAQVAERERLVGELLEERRRNEFLLLAAQVLSEVFDYRDMVKRLAQVAVPVLADLCLIDIAEEDGQIRRMAAWHADPQKRALTEELRTTFPPDPAGRHPTIEVMRSGRSLWSHHMTDEFLRATSRDERHYEISKLLGFTSYMTVPLGSGDDEVIGTVTLVSAGSGRRFSEKDLGLAEQLATQVSSVVSRARAYDRERRISHELQRNLLPDAIPKLPGWEVAARYLPAALGVEVGGDWYDVVPVSDRLVALVVGDVEGHDLEAARIMSRLRHTLGLLVLEEQAPGEALERLNRVALSGIQPRLATALVGVLDTVTGVVTFSSAGHPSPVRMEDGHALELVVPPGPPLGVQRCHYKDHEHQLAEGCLVMFTDGLVERRGVYLDDRLALLESSLRAAPTMAPDTVSDFVIDAMTADERSPDDIVVLAARRTPGHPGGGA
ncbi:MAG TPA: SpoIIE family protein phosphatase [Acidimicrobiales bacterium]|nr:SpoIIE family protein phosphatase [Acidimicrobiales bacterium]